MSTYIHKTLNFLELNILKWIITHVHWTYWHGRNTITSIRLFTQKYGSNIIDKNQPRRFALTKFPMTTINSRQMMLDSRNSMKSVRPKYLNKRCESINRLSPVWPRGHPTKISSLFISNEYPMNLNGCTDCSYTNIARVHIRLRCIHRLGRSWNLLFSNAMNIPQIYRDIVDIHCVHRAKHWDRIFDGQLSE